MITGNQIFKTIPDHTIVFGYLDDVCCRDRDYFVVDDIVHHRMRYDDRITRLYDYLRPFYHTSKQKYLDECCSRNGFLTVLRQLCKLYCIQFASKVVYRNGKYANTLTICLDRNNWSELPEPSS
jgi:hypothetical protein